MTNRLERQLQCLLVEEKWRMREEINVELEGSRKEVKKLEEDKKVEDEAKENRGAGGGT